ncbi:hypothetical protein BST36_23415 [Mycolicibacterium moriokaense]|uniref:LLM class flavin-dependent oxidoreductase n=1 Tax=Mycolicibacterium moriokaense TaxID=39691 RepID=UPI000A0B3508|nr:LLM class flavin-dependent oxidoreductase [Mycolicibacterium moriokaense]MCV7039171.1 LLM class flavin-dependent oxidoreductase [Mycolicibacterium moriokaense]ORB18545.1 hypothetical protein BST36_23415 [Mycolicibacterium moriokaense]
MINTQRLARQADAAGFDAQWSYEILRNPLMVAAAAAAVTNQSRLGTGIVGAFFRTPFDLANTAADVDDLSQGPDDARHRYRCAGSAAGLLRRRDSQIS